MNLPYSLTWNTAVMPELVLIAAIWMLDKLQKWVCRIVGPSLAASLEPLAHCQNVELVSLFYRYYFDRFSSDLAELVPVSYSYGMCTHNSKYVV